MGYLVLCLIDIFIVLILFLRVAGLSLGCWVNIGTLVRLARRIDLAIPLGGSVNYPLSPLISFVILSWVLLLSPTSVSSLSVLYDWLNVLLDHRLCAPTPKMHCKFW